MKNTPPDDTIINSDGQFIQISNVKPIPEPTPIVLNTDVPEKISRFYHYNDVRRFQFDRPVHKGIVDKENEIKTLWIERTILEIENSLPGILPWFEVISRTTEEVPPVKYACETMQAVQKELRQLIAMYSQEPKRNLNPFTMRLQGIIDANVQGGISKYQQAFFTQEFAKLCPEHMTYVYTLKNLIFDAIQVLECGLVLHGSLASAGVKPLHQRLIERFDQLKESLGSLNKMKRQQPDSIVNSPLPPLPIDKRYVLDNHSNRSSNSSGNYGQYSDALLDLEDNIYTKPMEVEKIPNRENLSLPMNNISVNAPPIPQRDSRPRSQGFNANYIETVKTPTRGSADYSSLPSNLKSRDPESCDIPLPPKPTHSRERSLTKPPSPRLLRHSMGTPTDGNVPLRNSWPDGAADEAPPLPPRSHTPDKRINSFPTDTPPNIPKRGQKKSTSSAFSIESMVDITLESVVVATNSLTVTEADHHDLRDSGISITDHSNLNNFNNTCYEDFDLRAHQQEMNISSSPSDISPKLENPPPIPPKSINSSFNTSFEQMGSLERRRVEVPFDAPSPENYSIPKMKTENGEGNQNDNNSSSPC
ncbi:hypothetical protein AMK59_7369 [Oryctes borbonicus]|uniref:DOCKER domain-containing protein n=1 Tax=Oryctes borbonicus TaxID=1629725 RepID=A0A0T6AX48_9SCAR|nr:hypothetical protein AMK59_7369 [Oryctes borbonicus]